MPRGDRTGPAGMGPMTGRGAGYCSGSPVPGFQNPVGGRLGLGFGWGRGRGMGRGYGYGRGYGRGAYPYPPTAPAPYSNLSKEQTFQMLKEQEQYLRSELEAIKKEIEKLSDSEKK